MTLVRRVDLVLAPQSDSFNIIPILLLPFSARQKSRQLARLENGEEIAIFLPPGSILHDGDILQADDGFRLRVQAEREPVIYASSDDHYLLLRAAYHLGNRHARVELGSDYLKLEYDPVLQELLVRLGLQVDKVSLPFDPEPGAYIGGHRHGHDESYNEDHEVAQKLYHDHHGQNS
ncbi:MAG: urease accessory protein UreE [Verrucomicrobia bacterium]|nr:urease accessory protein UreE [Verrucomicrobiota bacterium]